MSGIKRAVEAAVARGLGPWLTDRARSSPVVLAYHNVVPDGEPPGRDRPLHLPRSAFARQLDLLVESHQIVPLDRAMAALDGPPASDRPLAAITFDDAYRGAVTAGLEELARRELPCTLFVSPGLLGTEGFWWDRLARTAEGGSGTAEPGPGAVRSGSVRETLLVEEAGRHDRARARARREGWRWTTPPWHARPVGRGELEEAVGWGRMSLASHGWSHPNLARLDRGALEEELERPLEWLRGRFRDVSIPVLAYPFGRSSPDVEAAARKAGYEAAFTVSGGRLGSGSGDRFALPRVSVPAGVSPDGFRLRLLGLVR